MMAMAMPMVSVETSTEITCDTAKIPIAAIDSPSSGVLRAPIFPVSRPPRGAISRNVSASGAILSPVTAGELPATVWKRKGSSTKAPNRAPDEKKAVMLALTSERIRKSPRSIIGRGARVSQNKKRASKAAKAPKPASVLASLHPHDPPWLKASRPQKRPAESSTAPGTSKPLAPPGFSNAPEFPAAPELAATGASDSFSNTKATGAITAQSGTAIRKTLRHPRA